MKAKTLVYKPQNNVVKHYVEDSKTPTFTFVVPDEFKGLGLLNESMSALEYSFRRKRYDLLNRTLHRLERNQQQYGVYDSVSPITLTVPEDVTVAPGFVFRDLITGNYFHITTPSPTIGKDLRNVAEYAYGRAVWLRKIVKICNEKYDYVVKYDRTTLRKRSRREYDKICLSPKLANEVNLKLIPFFEARKTVLELRNVENNRVREKRSIADFV